METGNKSSNDSSASEIPKVELIVRKNGPYRVIGNFELTGASGQKLPHGDNISLCRCGHSFNKPFCDGMHNKKGFASGD